MTRLPEDRLTALSYIWPDGPERLERTRAALRLAAEDPPRVVAMRAEHWLPQALAAGDDETLTVVWESVVRQYVAPSAWETIERAFRATPGELQGVREPSGSAWSRAKTTSAAFVSR